MSTLSEWSPGGPGTYSARLTKIEDDLYPYHGSELLLEWIPSSSADQKESATYKLSELPKNKEPRGVCLRAEKLGNGSKLPSAFVVQLPDIGDIESESNVERYIRQFKPELDAELETLKHLDGCEYVANRLPYEDIVPFLTIPRDQVSDWKLGEKTEIIPVLMREYVEGEDLKTWCDNRQPGLEFQGLDPADWFDMVPELIVLVHKVHLAGATHGYICPGNIIVCKGSNGGRKLRLINFEREIPDLSLHLDRDPRIQDIDKPKIFWRRPFDCPEKVRHCGTPQSLFYDPFVPDDVFSLGQTLLYLATGKLVDPFVKEEPWEIPGSGGTTETLPWRKISSPIKKSNLKIKNDIRDLVQTRLPQRKNQEDVLSITEIIFACLRVDEHRFHNTRSIQEVF